MDTRFATPHCRIYAASSELSPYVVRYFDGQLDADELAPVRIPPLGSIHLTYSYGGPVAIHFSDWSCPDAPPLFFGGQLKTDFPTLQATEWFGLLGVEFTPTGFYRLFGQSPAPFTDSFTDFRQVRPRDNDELLRQLAAGRSAKDPVAYYAAELDRYLMAQLPLAKPLGLADQAVGLINAQRGSIGMDELARRCGASDRQLRREFVRVVGISPKQYAKVVQVNVAAGCIGRNDPHRLTEVALDHGYFDQAHFIHDFNRYIGTFPGDFLRSHNAHLRTYMNSRRIA